MVGDPVGDFIVRLTNAGAVEHDKVVLPYSKLKHSIAEKLVEAGYLASVDESGKKVKKTLSVGLKYDTNGRHAINGVKRVSKPGRRMYSGVNDIHPIKFGKGRIILSTPAGILTGEEARKQNVGGEQLFIIW